MNIRELKSISNDELSVLISGGEIVALLGAGISLWSPTDLPTGRDFTKALFRVLFHDECGRLVDQNEKLLKEVYDPLPFEIVNERCPDEPIIRELLRGIFNVYRPNPVHELVAKMLKENRMNTVITPNYDCSLDAAIASQYGTIIGRDMGDIRRVVDKDDIEGIDLYKTRLYLKIHGSADDPSGESLVFRIQQEGVLNPWKRKAFRQAIEGKILLIIGYSGSDFDICPEIPLAKPLRIIWNVRETDKDKIPPNPKAVSKKIETTFIAADMLDFLTRLFEPMTAYYGHSHISLENIFRKSFPEHVVRLWRTRILNSLNYNSAALTETTRFFTEGTRGVGFDIEVLSEHGGASASYGNYKQAARAHEQASKLAKDTGLPGETVYRQLLFASDAWRCFGDLQRAIIRHLQVVAGILELSSPTDSLRAGVFRNEALILRHPYDLFKRLYLKPFAWVIRQRAGKIMKKTIEILRETGEWYPLQQMELWRNRFDLPPEVTTLGGEYETPPSLEGYQQLNFPMGRMMAFRQHVDSGDIPLSEENGKEARRLANLAIGLSIHPEIWKLHLLILRKFKSERRFNNDLSAFWQSFKDCEYSFLFRIWRLILRG